jgi:cytochrome o ubiquinol oxidase subunit 1
VPAASPRYEPIEVPRNSPIGIVLAFFAVVTGFALVWHIWWMAVLGLLSAFAIVLVFAWRDDTHEEISAEDLAMANQSHRRAEQLA